eukprot:m.211374 g.211374  ORF g.211374 m.211374 type:complete len:104 (-) comp17148_c0_seq25:47-358(-)
MANRLAAVLYRLEVASGAPNREDLVSNVERLRVLVETLEQQLGMENDISLKAGSESKATLPAAAMAVTNTASSAQSKSSCRDDPDEATHHEVKTKGGGCCEIL